MDLLLYYSIKQLINIVMNLYNNYSGSGINKSENSGFIKIIP